jgi:hypothetical protein
MRLQGLPLRRGSRDPYHFQLMLLLSNRLMFLLSMSRFSL